jgi:4-diphosphocytidyl-2-C-methyl-D-erythritol kinase
MSGAARRSGEPIREHAPGKLNLLLHVGRRRGDGLHEICSLFARINLADELSVTPLEGGVDGSEAGADGDAVLCPGVSGPNLAAAALEAYRREADPDLPLLRVEIEKRIPVAAGLGGGSADAAAALRAANRLSRAPLAADALRELAFSIGADVPSQVEPGHALVTGAGEVVEPVALPQMALVLVNDADGLSAAEVYAEADRTAATREALDPVAVRGLAAEPLPTLSRALANDLEPAALSLRPALAGRLERLRQAGALAALITGSGPTAFGVFPDRAAASRAVAAVHGGRLAMVES